jgi:peptidoglycan/xylan/chitin deacetylase (PgdA/CDA1 family)
MLNSSGALLNRLRKFFMSFVMGLEVGLFLVCFQTTENRFGLFDLTTPDYVENNHGADPADTNLDIPGTPTSQTDASSTPAATPGNIPDQTPAPADNIPGGEKDTPLPTPTNNPNGGAEATPMPSVTPSPSPDSESSNTSGQAGNIREPIHWGNTDEKVVYLTFDDGYDGKSITTVLDVLKDRGIKSTFFAVGDYLEYFPDIWKRAVEEGHFICNHTKSHKTLNLLSSDEIKKEITGWEKVAGRILGEEYVKKMKEEFPYIRLPGGGGHNSKRVLEIVAECGYIPIGWSLETYSSVIARHDYINEPSGPIVDEVVNHVLENSKNGIIILLHFNLYDTPKIDKIVDGLTEKGFAIENINNIFQKHP